MNGQREDLVNLTPHLSPASATAAVVLEAIDEVEAETAGLLQMLAERPWAGTMVPDPLSLHYRITAIERALISNGRATTDELRYWAAVACRDQLRLTEQMTRKAPPGTARRQLERAGLVRA